MYTYLHVYAYTYIKTYKKKKINNESDSLYAGAQHKNFRISICVQLIVVIVSTAGIL